MELFIGPRLPGTCNARRLLLINDNIARYGRRFGSIDRIDAAPVAFRPLHAIRSATRRPSPFFRAWGERERGEARVCVGNVRTRVGSGTVASDGGAVMIFLTYVINEPRAVSCAVHMGLFASRTPDPLYCFHPSDPSSFVRTRSLARARPSCERAPPARRAHGGISCAHNRASLTNNPLDATGEGRHLKSGLARYFRPACAVPPAI